MSRFERSVYRHSSISTGCKLLLIYLWSEANAKGIVSVPRSQLARALAVAPARITEWISAAKQAGFISVVTEGKPGTTAVYHLLVVGTDSGPPLGTEILSKQGVRNPDQESDTSTRQLGTDFGYPYLQTAANGQTPTTRLSNEAATG